MGYGNYIFLKNDIFSDMQLSIKSSLINTDKNIYLFLSELINS